MKNNIFYRSDKSASKENLYYFSAQRSNFEADAKDASLQNISKRFKDKTNISNSIIVFSDAKSVLQSLGIIWRNFVV